MFFFSALSISLSLSLWKSGVVWFGVRVKAREGELKEKIVMENDV